MPTLNPSKFLLYGALVQAPAVQVQDIILPPGEAAEGQETSQRRQIFSGRPVRAPHFFTSLPHGQRSSCRRPESALSTAQQQHSRESRPLRHASSRERLVVINPDRPNRQPDLSDPEVGELDRGARR